MAWLPYPSASAYVARIDRYFNPKKLFECGRGNFEFFDLISLFFIAALFLTNPGRVRHSYGVAAASKCLLSCESHRIYFKRTIYGLTNFREL